MVLHRTRELLVRQRTMLIKAIRGHCVEFGIIGPQGARRACELVGHIRQAEPAELPELAQSALLRLAEQLDTPPRCMGSSVGCLPGVARTRQAKDWRPNRASG